MGTSKRLVDIMSDGGRGVQAFRWFTAIGVAAVGYLAFQTLQLTDRTAQAVTALQIQFSALSTMVESRINAQADRLRAQDDKNTQQDIRMDRQDGKIDAIQEKVWKWQPK